MSLAMEISRMSAGGEEEALGEELNPLAFQTGAFIFPAPPRGV